MKQDKRSYVLITGATSGIGKQLSLEFASQGHSLVLVSRTEKKLERLAAFIRKEYNVLVHYFEFDLSSQKKVIKLFHAIDIHDLRIDYLINNAAQANFSEFVEADWARNESLISTNITAVAHLCHLFIPLMIEQGGGYVLNISSDQAFIPSPLLSVYGASKSFIQSFSLALAAELQDLNVKVSVFIPGEHKTKLYKRAGIPYYPVREKQSKERMAAIVYRKMHRGARVIYSEKQVIWKQFIRIIQNKSNLANRLYAERLFKSNGWMD